ncbi:MAG TPA: SurA N-terminal domain-containing protein [Candidatus Saccharimonadales bacterium]|nr:SurA N-terminal domain-containing protein [Candidatus Saccharimonadales bacterium]
MKKLRLKRRDKASKQAPARITNETVAEHRERILAGGRRFKYPMQYAKHRLVFNTILVTIVALLLVVLVGWWQLYIVQNTSTFFYRVTRVLPLPVASIDGESVRYGDYLMYYNSSAHYLQRSEQLNLSSEDGKRQLDFVKRKSMNTVLADAYAAKLAHDLGITISNDRIDKVIDDDRNTANGRISQETYDASALNVLGWSPDEYREDVKAKLTRQDVSYSIDTQAKQKEEKAAELIKTAGPDFDKIAAELSGESKVESGISGLVSYTNRDGGLSAAAVKLNKDEVSGVIKTTTGDGYYFIRLLEKTDTQVSYAFLKIPLTEFNKRLTELKKAGKVKEFIQIPEVQAQGVTDNNSQTQ